ncbi:MAG: GmrSD restriction endonuclease domain-containing protein [Candidatus Limnocylindrales bacterium]
MEARNRYVPDWFTRIRTGQIRLPRFQRTDAWSHGEVTALLESVLRGLPTGAALILDVGDREPFVSRTMLGAPAPTERVTEHLLDGQQRLTALWRSLNDLYEDRTYFASATTVHDDRDAPTVTGVGRWLRPDLRRFPLWADLPVEQYEHGLIPLRLLRPGDVGDEVSVWCDTATQNDLAASRSLERRVLGLRETVAAFNIPFLSLPVDTPPDVAIDVFVKLNTTSVPLSAFEIIVAQVEAATGQPLRDLAGQLRARVPALEAYVDPFDAILGVAALRQDRSPTQASFFRLDLDELVRDWEDLSNGVAGAVDFLTEEKVFDKDRLPTVAVIPILSALWSVVPTALDELGNARTLLRKYLWRAFVTRRYEQAAGTRALQDYRALLAVLQRRASDEQVPIFDEDIYPLPTPAELKRASWPKGRDILARGILAVSLRGGGLDLADGTPVRREVLRSREYHHLFPDSLLTQYGLLDEATSYRALNCALITWNTNRRIAASEPVEYLRERVARAALGEEEIRSRLATHSVPFDSLNVGGYAAMADASARARRIQQDYESFLDARADAIEDGVQALCRGQDWSGLRSAR